MAIGLNSNSLYGLDLFNGLLREDNLTIHQTGNASQTVQTIKDLIVLASQSVVTISQGNVTPQHSSNINIPSQSNSNKLRPKADLVGQISSIGIPDTIEFGDDGTVKVTVTNRGNATAKGPLSIKLYISTDGDIDVNDGLLTTLVKNINLKPGKSQTFTLNYQNLTGVVAPGAYKIIAQIDSENAIAERNENNNIVTKHISAPGTDVAIDWNATALNAIQAEGEAGRGVPPTEGSRLLAMVSAAVYDAVNAFERTHTSYSFDGFAPVGASVQAAVVGAAYRVLTELLPQQTALFNEQLLRSIFEIKDNPFSEISGFLFGSSVGEEILSLRQNDGWDNDTPIVYPSGDYVWHPAAAGEPNAGVAVGTHWGKVTPFAINSVADFAPDGLDGLPGTQQYADEIEEVRLLGGKQNTNVTTIARNADQTEIAVFWAYDRADTFRPYGQLNQIAEEVAIREGNTLSENARLFAQLNIALADAAIVAWNAKYKTMQPRPDDVIAEGFAAKDGMPGTIADSDWEPLLGPTPPFPDYISGHSSFGGAFAGVMTNFFGEDYGFTAVSQELIHTTRHYDSFYDAAYDDAISRVYGGIHVREATITDALPMGWAVGNFVAENLFVPIDN
ncbi:MAG TPA: phosphoesterase [Cyanobacteria bacterium UBA11149]|nr:phosphoesterase [Cyanobacteria bacterium UBA11367]HBE58941.1 phosphoesterase [Cyanobacteria bacterium UBA11366]HBK66780.1 phosphoesterase [Cyanobacteria bacterium UBA11166]HBR73367.1 phosphoesterase [Cyanobacteria bacterium UBA11159]HBS72171.1 phosphoesterase [Cyanobacteria bacterium UBA11153]HBW88219.1 phosphoesterase [Cyanobacteria bacterium UBA11149]HCA95581.1 phosphoesterase [Cyanobacteria bacterium UBA9226]